MRKLLYIFLCVVAVIIAIFTILSVFRDTESRYLKMMDFPRIQFFLASILSIIVLWIVLEKWKWFDAMVMIGLLIGLFGNGYYLINYTQIVPVEVPWANAPSSSEDTFSLLITNVKMSNENSRPLIDLINKNEPDLILAMEVNHWWGEQLKVLEKRYPYNQKALNEVAYGMALYSKFPLKDVEVNYLNNDNVPSFVSTISILSGKTFTFYSVHPVPPTNFKELPDNEGQRESALKKLGKMVENRKFPTLVAGDLNDVVWSHVDELTGTEDILYDIRVGRGLFNSYNAENIFMRWPLDHVFVTEEFKLKNLERKQYIDSDHYPIFVELKL